MKEEIKVPTMGESISEATVSAFLKPSGAAVHADEEIIELETEKVNQVLYAPISGVITWSVKEGDTFAIGDVIGLLDTEGAPSSTPPEPEPQEPLEIATKQEVKKPSPSPAEGARKMEGAFIAELSEKNEEPPPPKATPSKGRESRRKMSKIRETIARRLVDSLHSAAMLTTFNEVDMSAVMGLRAKYKESFQEKHGVKLGFMSFFVKAVVEALKSFPDFNSYIDGDEVVQRHYYDIGIAVGTEKGLVVPVLRHTDQLTFPEIEREIIAYAKRAREKKLSISDLEGGGFTITNGGVYGSLLSTPIINPPQVGILGMHKIAERAVVEKGEIVIRPMMYLALSYDHRLVDGKEAVSFLIHVKEVLEDPSRLMFLDVDDGKI